jgi:hypothetical protein
MDVIAINLLLAAWFAACAIVLIVVHEAGHYLAGLLGGIPAGDMRIRLWAFPQHVVLREGDRWLSPNAEIEQYVAHIWQRLQTTPKVYLYTSGGLILETAFMAVVSVVLLFFGWPKIAFAVAGLSLMLLLPWLVVDAVSIYRGRIAGDLSGLWYLARLPTVLFIVGLLATRGAILWYSNTLGAY